MKKFIFLSGILITTVSFFAQTNRMAEPGLVNADYFSPLLVFGDNNVSTTGYEVKTIELPNQIKLEYAEQGDAKGIPVILLHGFTDSWHSYEAVLSHLPSSVHVYAISQRGHGNSSKPASGYDPQDFASDVEGFMKQLKIAKAVIVGHSMGGSVVQAFAVKYPSLTEAVVFAGSFADYNKPGIQEFKNLIDQLSEPIDSVFIAEFQKSTIVRPIPETMLAKFISESQKVPAHVWKGVAAGWERSTFLNSLKQFNQPALVIWGDKDLYAPHADQELLTQAIKNSKLLVYEGTGHAIHWEEPARFAKDLLSFLERVKYQDNYFHRFW